MVHNLGIVLSENQIKNKSFDFAVRIVNLYNFLTEQKKNLFYQSNFFVQEQVLVLCFRSRKRSKQSRFCCQNEHCP